MFRTHSFPSIVCLDFPHACGDVPSYYVSKIAIVLFSPRMWGCSEVMVMDASFDGIFPTHVGMFRIRPAVSFAKGYFPHACGDVPGTKMNNTPSLKFSPRMWGCSATPPCGIHRKAIFPTHVGMFRLSRLWWKRWRNFPLACGDVPRLVELLKLPV